MMHRHGTCQTVATESQNVKESAFANVGCCSQNRRLATSDCHIVDYIVLYWRYYIMNHIALCHSMLYHYCYYLDVVIYIYIYIYMAIKHISCRGFLRAALSLDAPG